MGGSEKSSSIVVYQNNKKVPKGYLAVKVGCGDEEEEEKRQRFVIPVIYFNHPLFLQLLREAEDEYGFDQKGAITIPCHVDDFLFVQSVINKERRHRHNHHHRVACFRL